MKGMKMDITRRGFVAGAGTIAAGAAAVGTLPSVVHAAAPVEDNGDWLGDKPGLSEADCTQTVDADVVVIGSALAGEMAAYAAVLGGAKVVMLERNGTAHVSGSGIGFLNSKFQLGAGQPEHDPYEVIERLNNQFQNRSDLAFLSAWAFHSGQVLDELEATVLVPAGIPGTANVTPENGLDEFCPSLNSHVDFDPTGSDSLETFNATMHAWIKEQGGQIFYDTTARVLIQGADGTVTGVVAQDNDSGDYTYYKAAKGVIVCTGSYGHNEKMMQHFANSWVCNFAKNYGVYNARVSTSTPITTDETMDDGLGHKMMCWAGAVMEQSDPSFQAWEDSNSYYWWPFLAVTCKGERFRNEQSSWLSQVNTVVERPEGVNYYWQIRELADTDMPLSLQTGVTLDTWDQIVEQSAEYRAER